MTQEVHLPNLDRLKSLLEKETFPYTYIHKIIGKNTFDFAEATSEFEAMFPNMKLTNSRLSKGDLHVALTYTFTAENVQEIISVVRASHALPDIQIVL